MDIVKIGLGALHKINHSYSYYYHDYGEITTGVRLEFTEFACIVCYMSDDLD